jgi:HK97 family phage major capsid protein
MSTETTITSAKAWAPDVTAVAPEDAVPEALILETSTVAGEVEGDAPAVRVQYVDDASAGFVAEGVAIDEADPDLAEVLVYTGKISQLVRLSREQWRQDNAAALLSESVQRAVTKAANVAYVAQAAPSGPAVTPPAGLLNVSGIVDGGAVADNLDMLIDLQAQLAGNDGNPTHILLSPTAWANLRKFKDGATSERSLLGAGTEDTVRSLLNLPVLVSNAVPTDTGLMLDRNAIVSAVGEVMVAQSEHAYFNSDSIGLRCTWRFGANVVHPDRIGKFTVEDPLAT